MTSVCQITFFAGYVFKTRAFQRDLQTYLVHTHAHAHTRAQRSHTDRPVSLDFRFVRIERRREFKFSNRQNHTDGFRFCHSIYPANRSGLNGMHLMNPPKQTKRMEKAKNSVLVFELFGFFKRKNVMRSLGSVCQKVKRFHRVTEMHTDRRMVAMRTGESQIIKFECKIFVRRIDACIYWF